VLVQRIIEAYEKYDKHSASSGKTASQHKGGEKRQGK
jgi:hypothetical protein